MKNFLSADAPSWSLYAQMVIAVMVAVFGLFIIMLLLPMPKKCKRPSLS
jgi:hypothetical protein